MLTWPNESTMPCVASIAVGGDEVFDQLGECGHGGVSPDDLLDQNFSSCFGTATVSTRGRPGWWP